MPEIPYDISAICDAIKKRNAQGKNFSIIVVGEGAHAQGGKMHVGRTVKNSPDAIRLGGVSHQIAAQLEALTHIECRVTILGHLLRGGSPSAHDRLLAMRFAIEAVHLSASRSTGRMVSLRGDTITSIPISEVAGKQRKVTLDHPWVKAAGSLGICLGAPLEVPLEEYVA